MTDSPPTVLTSASTQTSSYARSSPPKRKRRPAGTPDPDAEVIALSPKTLMESDRYVCEICNQGFQRDQNLQMHRRRHKVPWKLLKRADPEARKRVYVCPEPSCLHHHPGHALGDLVGIKKHYRRKHSSMKQWECDKCSKAYAVQSDYKAHLKTCGTRGHCCDCGRVFSRVESFIEHQDTCTAASNKRGVASISEQQETSLPSLAAAAPADHPYHAATLMPINPSSSTETVMKKDNHHHTVLMNLPLKSRTNDQACGVSALPLLPYMHSACPAHVLGPVVTSAHMSLPTASPGPPVQSFLLATILPPQTRPPETHQPDMPGCAKFSWDIQQTGLPAPGDPNLLGMHHKAELQLLPTKPDSSQLEPSESSNICTWGKDITSTNSNTSATICSSSGGKIMDHEKHILSASAGLPSDIAPCKLQLSIGFVHDDHQTTYNEDSSSLQVLRVQPEATGAELRCDSKTANMPWLARTSSPHEKHRDTLSKKQCSPCTAPEKMGSIGHDKDAIRLELGTGVAWPAGSNTLHDMRSLEMQKKQDYDDFCCKKGACVEAVNAGFGDPENARMDERSQRRDDDRNSQLGSLKRSNSSSGSVAVVAPADQQRPTEAAQPSLLSGQIAEYTQPHQSELSFDSAPPQLAAAELRLQRAREKLKRALEEKLEAEKAWKEAKKEQAEAGAELAAGTTGSASDYKRPVDDEEGVENSTHNYNYNYNSSASSLTLSNSLAAMSSSSCQVSTSADAMPMQLNTGGVIVSGTPTLITCPACHHVQILYHPANLRGTLFLPSQEFPTPLKGPFPPNPISEL